MMIRSYRFLSYLAFLVLASCKGSDGIVGQPAGPAARIVLTSAGLNDVAGVGVAHIAARVVDSVGEGVSGVEVHWAVRSGGGSVDPSTSVSLAGGAVRTAFTFGNVFGAESVTATAAGVAPLIVVDSAMVPPHINATWGRDPPTSPPGTVLDSFVVTFHLDDGRPFINAPVRWAVIWEGFEQDSTGNPRFALVHPGAKNTDATGRAAAQATVGTAPSASIMVVGGVLVQSASGVAGEGSFEITWPLPAFYAQIASGNFTSCSLSKTGAAYCFGWDQYGQFGADPPAPEIGAIAWPVSGGLSFSKIAMGRRHACAVTAAGDVYCWGNNQSGQIGQGVTDSVRRPTRVPLPEAADTVIAGNFDSCALGVSGQAYCWGDNTFGTLGDGTTTERDSPVAVATSVRFTKLANLGFYARCGLTAGGEAWCWGDNSSGQLGNGNEAAQFTPTPVSGGHSFKALMGGDYHACGLEIGGALFCWGDNSLGQLGDGTFVPHLTPMPVAGGRTYAFLASGLGWQHSCAIDVAGVAFCWGDDSYGQLGSGWATDAPTLQLCQPQPSTFYTCSPVPVPVRLHVPFTALTMGSYHSCGLTAAGAAYCWGNNQVGELGDGTYFSESLNPSAVQLPASAARGRSNPAEALARQPAKGGAGARINSPVGRSRAP